ncbi:hypothetical protein SERLA73DRAFT_181093, partial [Serpula lacrymans var. lacrymans S7.3]
MNGNTGITRLLLVRQDMDPNSKDLTGRTSLSLAAEEGHSEVVQLLLARHGINIDSKDAYGQTPLWLAARHGHAKTVECLLAFRNIDVNVIPMHSYIPPLWAAACRYLDHENDILAQGSFIHPGCSRSGCHSITK